MTTKIFDAVKMMRELRDRLSDNLAEMDPADRQHYVREKAASYDIGRRCIQELLHSDRKDDALNRAP